MVERAMVESKSPKTTLGEQLRWCARRFPDKTAVYYADTTLSYADLDCQVDILALNLMDMGVKPGERILLAFNRRPDLLVAFLAVARVGAIMVPLSATGSVAEIHKTINLLRPSGLIIHQDLLDSVGETPGWTVVIDSSEWGEKLRSRSDDVLCENQSFPEVSEDDPVYFNLTSGSTGNPKASVASYRHLNANTVACVDVFQLTPDDIHLPLFAVMSHPHEIFCRALYTGASIVLVDKLYPRSIAQAISRHKVTCMMAVAPVYEILMPFLDNAKTDFSSLRLPECGGMATPEVLAMRFKEQSGIDMVPVWGSTETMGVAFASRFKSETPSHSCGKCLPGYEVMITGTDGQPVKQGEVGELWIRGPGVTDGYWEDPKLNAHAFTEGWFKTSDLFKQDDSGNFYCVGRKDAMLKVGGLKVYPAEIEAVLFAHPQIRDAVVLPYNDRLRGVIAMAAVVIEPGETLTESQIRQHLKSRLSLYKIPRIIRILHDLPRTAAGKVNRKALIRGDFTGQDVVDASLQRRMAAVDLKILHLLNERLRLALELREHDPTGFQPERIQETIRTLQEFNPGPIHDSIVEELFHRILSIQQYL